jgi:hypothetical protein
MNNVWTQHAGGGAVTVVRTTHYVPTRPRATIFLLHVYIYVLTLLRMNPVPLTNPPKGAARARFGPCVVVCNVPGACVASWNITWGAPSPQPGSTGLKCSAESSGSTLQPEVALSTPRLHSPYGKPMSPDGPTLGSGSVSWVDCTVRTTDRIDVVLTALLSPNGTRQKIWPVRPRAHRDLAIRIETGVVAKSFFLRYIFDP